MNISAFGSEAVWGGLWVRIVSILRIFYWSDEFKICAKNDAGGHLLDMIGVGKQAWE